MTINEEAQQQRKTEHDINPLILGRWSPRAMSGEEISDEELMSIFEAAKWAPSSFNNQPWRFIYAKRDSQHWERLLSLPYEGNQAWAKSAAVLVVIISKKTFDHNGKPSKTHTFDTGAAWENMALEATSRDIVVHGMEGFDYDKARVDLEIPDEYKIEAMAGIGKRGEKEKLPEGMQKMESPNSRKELKEIIMEGKFRK